MSLTQSLHLQLTPMQVPDANPVGTVVGWSSEAARDVAAPAQQLKIVPGEPSELVVQVHNTSQRSLFLRFHVSGNFPLRWCRLGTEGHELPPGQRMEAVLYFEIDADFFEARQALAPGQAQMLDYPGQVQVYAGTTAAETLMATQSFSLHVRPHSRYLDFLPAVYHEVDFIGRFLKLFEQSFDPAVQVLASLWAYLDPLTAPEAMLPFLAQWVGWPSEVPWSLEQQRRLIRRAMEIYRWRGTRKGLRLYLHLYTGLPLEEDPTLPEAQKQISIQEVFSRGFLIETARLDQDAILGGGRPFHFTVRLRTPYALDERLIHTIIAQEKPAFCTYDLLIESA
ncbi:MAG: phage tail protein [Cyanobacteria bacterium P01_A01_bin.114]